MPPVRERSVLPHLSLRRLELDGSSLFQYYNSTPRKTTNFPGSFPRLGSFSQTGTDFQRLDAAIFRVICRLRIAADNFGEMTLLGTD